MFDVPIDGEWPDIAPYFAGMEELSLRSVVGMIKLSRATSSHSTLGFVFYMVNVFSHYVYCFVYAIFGGILW